MRLILGHELEKIREKISCKQFGDDHYGEWGILTLNQRRTILRMIETIQYLDRAIEDAVIGNHPPFKNKADFVEVVRCKDCEHYKPQSTSAHWNNKKRYCCRSATVKANDYDFCSYGKRKGGD